MLPQDTLATQKGPQLSTSYSKHVWDPHSSQPWTWGLPWTPAADPTPTSPPVWIPTLICSGLCQGACRMASLWPPQHLKQYSLHAISIKWQKHVLFWRSTNEKIVLQIVRVLGMKILRSSNEKILAWLKTFPSTLAQNNDTHFRLYNMRFIRL